MTKINYKSDFSAMLQVFDGEGNDVGFPDYDFTAEFYTSGVNKYVASSIGGVLTNCQNNDGRILVLFDNHHLGVGELQVRFIAQLPAEDYPDTKQQICSPKGDTGIELVLEAALPPDDVQIQAILPYIKGRPFTYEDFTDEQLKGLTDTVLAQVQPSVDAAIDTLNETNDTAQEAENQRIAAETLRSESEQQRIANEQSRAQAEVLRTTDENTRITNEQMRIAEESQRVLDEDERIANEEIRVNAESERAESEQQRESAESKRESSEQKRADAETLRVNAESARADAESKRVSAENSRVDAESKRVAAEQSRVSAESERVSAESKRESDFAAAKADAEKAAEYATQQGDYAKEQAESIAVVDNKIEELLKHLGKYGDISHEEITLKTALSGYAINTDGTKVAKSGYAMSESFALTQGNIYLIKAAAVSKEISLFARVSIEQRTDTVSYTYTYNDDNSIATASPTYDTSIVYQFNYTTGDDGESVLDNITLNGSIVSELPTTHTYDVEVYNPLFKTGAIATPLSGFYVYFCPTSMNIVVSAQASDLTQSDSDEYKGKMFGERYGIFASIASNYVNRWERDELDERITAIENSLAYKNFMQDDFCVKAWVTDNLSPDAVESYGQEQFLWDLWRFYLIDTTDNTGITTKPVGELVRDNLLRFQANNTFAPTVGISESQAADAELELFRLIDGEYVQYCEAGAYDAESYLEDVLRPVVAKTPNDLSAAKLYKLVDEEYIEAHAVLPWETTETKYSVNLGNYRDVYALDNTEGESGKTWIGLFSKPTKWDGIDVSRYKLPPTAISPSPVTVVNDTFATSFFFAYNVGWKNCGNVGGADGGAWGLTGAAFPRRWDMQQVTNMTYARKCNADTTKPYPCAEGGFFAFNCALNTMEAAMGTKYLHSTSRFTTGISSNDACGNETQFNTNGGFRCRVSGSDTWSYAKWNAQPPIRYNNTNTSKTATALVNQESPKEHCMESQMAYSWAQEFGIAAGVEFEFYGYTYWYKNVASAASGKMNAVVYSRRSGTKDLYNSSKEETTWDWEFVLRMGLYMGLRLSGDVYCYRGGGYEQVAEFKSGNTNEPIRLYLQPDQTKWVRETSINIAGKFSFEDVYPLEGTLIRTNQNWVKKRLHNTDWDITKGGTISTGECYYGYTSHYWGGSLSVPFVRIAARFGGYAYDTHCSPRYLFANASASSAPAYSCGSAQFLIDVS
jgi:hypothetical protein